MKLRSLLSRLPLALPLALAAGCLSPADGYRDGGRDPDALLASLWDVYESGEWSTTGDRGSSTVMTDRAAYEIERLALEFPRHVPSLFAVALISFEDGQPEKASSYLDALFKVQPAHPEAGLLRSRIAIRDGNLPAAERVLDQQIRYTPDHAGLHEARAAVAFLGGEHQLARDELELAWRLGAPEARTAFNQGLVAEAQGQDSAAIGFYERALAADPELAAAGSRLAGLRARAGEALPR